MPPLKQQALYSQVYRTPDSLYHVEENFPGQSDHLTAHCTYSPRVWDHSWVELFKYGLIEKKTDGTEMQNELSLLRADCSE